MLDGEMQYLFCKSLNLLKQMKLYMAWTNIDKLSDELQIHGLAFLVGCELS